MGRRIEVELTSSRDDGSWTWRAAGAKQPKGDLDGSLLYSGAKVGDVVRAEADFHLDGIEIVEVFPPKGKKERSDLLELKSRPLRDDELVTTQRVSRGDRRGDRGRRGDRPRRGGSDDRRDRRSARSKPPSRPKPKRLRAKRAHRDALLASVPEEHRPIVEQVVRDGMPGVRAAIDRQNTEAKEASKPEIEAGPVLAIAEQHLPAARLAEWRDRADAALADAAELDLRDLRSVVVVGGDVARDDESRAIADQLKQVLDERMESDHTQWLGDLRSAVLDGRTVRALRLSSRPVKAGAPLPTELASELAQQASNGLAPDVEQSRWATVLDALAFSPVRGAVTPAGIPAEPGEELLAEVRRLSDRIPAIAGLFGIDPAEVPKSAKRRRRSRNQSDRDRKGRKPKRDNQGAAKGSDNGSKPRNEAKVNRTPDQKPEAEPKPKAEAKAGSEPKPDTAAESKPEDSKPVADTAATEAETTPAGDDSSSTEAESIESAPTSDTEAGTGAVEADGESTPEQSAEADSAEASEPAPVASDTTESPAAEPGPSEPEAAETMTPEPAAAEPAAAESVADEAAPTAADAAVQSGPVAETATSSSDEEE